ncbi:unnamed protein product [Chrysoparadoxa australica]
MASLCRLGTRAGQGRRGIHSACYTAAARSRDLWGLEEKSRRWDCPGNRPLPGFRRQRSWASFASSASMASEAPLHQVPAPVEEAEQASKEPAPTTAQKPKTRRKLRERPAPIVLTERAADRLKLLLGKKPSMLGVRLGVKRRGCNGYSYTLNYVSEPPAKDEEVYAHGVRLFVDPMATFYVVGTVMDWEETELSAEFTFSNPNAKGECGCGESFNV